jgi:hypothetical protein
MPQRFRPPETRQGHEPQQDQDVHCAVKALGQGEMPVQSAQQPIGAQRRKPRQQAAEGHIPARLVTRGGALHQSERRGHPLVAARAGRSHAFGRLRVHPRALRFGRRLRLRRRDARLRRNRPDHAPAANRLAQRRLANLRAPRRLGNRMALRENMLALGLFPRRHHRRAARGARREERFGTFLFPLRRPVHQRSMRDLQRGVLHLAGARKAVDDQRCDDKTSRLFIRRGVGKIVVRPDPIRHAPFLGEYSYGRIDLNCALRKSRQHQLWHG